MLHNQDRRRGGLTRIDLAGSCQFSVSFSFSVHALCVIKVVFTTLLQDSVSGLSKCNLCAYTDMGAPSPPPQLKVKD